MTVKTLSIPCPTCKKTVVMNETYPHRPFCSKRCQMIDFGEWAGEGHKIEGKPLLSDEENEGWSTDLDS